MASVASPGRSAAGGRELLGRVSGREAAGAGPAADTDTDMGTGMGIGLRRGMGMLMGTGMGMATQGSGKASGSGRGSPYVETAAPYVVDLTVPPRSPKPPPPPGSLPPVAHLNSMGRGQGQGQPGGGSRKATGGGRGGMGAGAGAAAVPSSGAARGGQRHGAKRELEGRSEPRATVPVGDHPDDGKATPPGCGSFCGMSESWGDDDKYAQAGAPAKEAQIAVDFEILSLRSPWISIK